MNVSASSGPFGLPAPYPLQSPLVNRATPKSPGRSAHVARVKASLLRAAEDALDMAGFVQVIPQTLTTLAGACGDPGTLIPVQVAGEQAYLRQTSQLHLEPSMMELGAVYSITRSFRSERRADDRHLTEFTLVEAEVAGWSLEELMRLIERMVSGMLSRAAAQCSPSLGALGIEPQTLLGVAPPFRRMRYDDAIISLQRMGYFVEWGEDLVNEHELALTEKVGGPLFVTHYPVGLRFFTMKIDRDDPRVVQCCDLLLPGVGEVLGASETETDPVLLERKLNASSGVRQIRDLGGSTRDYDWYLDMRRKSSGVQAGFGLGFERLVRYACGLRSVSDAI